MKAGRKDKMTLYMLRNALSTLVIAFVSFMISLISYYECSFVEALRRLFFVNIYTTLYFLLLWLLNYMIFEISKIIFDTYENILTYKFILVLCLVAIILFFSLYLLYWLTGIHKLFGNGLLALIGWVTLLVLICVVIVAGYWFVTWLMTFL